MYVDVIRCCVNLLTLTISEIPTLDLTEMEGQKLCYHFKMLVIEELMAVAG